jgi:hypothetical protein
MMNVDKQTRALTQSRVGLALLLGAGSLLLVGCHHDEEAATTTTPPTTSPTKVATGGPGGPGGGPQGILGAKKGVRGQNPLATPGPGTAGKGKGVVAKADPFAPAAAPTPPGTAAPLPLSGKKKDPFYPDWHLLPPPPDPLASGDVQPIRVASAGYEPPAEQEVTVREVPDRRVSGIMSGDGVFAIIEQNGESEVVKPGGTTKDGYRVLAINEDSVKLQKKVGNLSYTQTVQLSDIQAGGTTQTFGRQGGVGQSSYGRSGPGQPGLGGGRGGGGGGGGGGGEGG